MGWHRGSKGNSPRGGGVQIKVRDHYCGPYVSPRGLTGASCRQESVWCHTTLPKPQPGCDQSLHHIHPPPDQWVIPLASYVVSL